MSGTTESGKRPPSPDKAPGPDNPLVDRGPTGQAAVDGDLSATAQNIDKQDKMIDLLQRILEQQTEPSLPTTDDIPQQILNVLQSMDQ